MIKEKQPIDKRLRLNIKKLDHKKVIAKIQETVNNALIYDLENDVDGKWIKSWIPNHPPMSLSGHALSGFNWFWTTYSARQLKYDSLIFGTFNQWKEEGLRLKAGSKCLKLLRPILLDKKDTDGNIETDINGNQKKFIYFVTYPVFNIAQIDDSIEGASKILKELEKKFQKTLNDGASTIKEIEQFVKNTKAVIEHNGSPCFIPSQDKILMPPIEQFETEVCYYSTLCHELTHWTGAEKRLNRTQKWNTNDYAFEELIAELGSAYLSSYLGIEAQPRKDHARYIKSWIKGLKDDTGALLKASSMSGKAVNYLIDLQPKKEELKKVA